MYGTSLPTSRSCLLRSGMCHGRRVHRTLYALRCSSWTCNVFTSSDFSRARGFGKSTFACEGWADDQEMPKAGRLNYSMNALLSRLADIPCLMGKVKCNMLSSKRVARQCNERATAPLRTFCTTPQYLLLHHRILFHQYVQLRNIPCSQIYETIRYTVIYNLYYVCVPHTRSCEVLISTSLGIARVFRKVRIIRRSCRLSV